jgi:hypothetical protein
VAILDSVDWAVGDSPAGGAFARQSDGTFVTLSPDTRGAANGT